MFFLSLKLLGNFFATSLLQVKETHKLLENFATWASKTEAALTLFVSILRLGIRRNPSRSDYSLRSRSRSKSINCDMFIPNLAIGPVPSLWTATKGLTKPSWCWEAQDWHVEMMTKCQTRRELVLTDIPANKPQSHAISGHIEFECHKCLCEFEKRKGFHPHVCKHAGSFEWSELQNGSWDMTTWLNYPGPVVENGAGYDEAY